MAVTQAEDEQAAAAFGQAATAPAKLSVALTGQAAAGGGEEAAAGGRGGDAAEGEPQVARLVSTATGTPAPMIAGA